MRTFIVQIATRYLGSFHRVLYSATGGRLGARIWGLDIVLLTTTGRKSGRPRVVPLCSLREGQSFVVIASYGGLDRSPSWWLNLQRDPRATLQVGRIAYEVVAREAMLAERDRLWTQVTARAPGYLRYQERTTRKIAVVLLEPPRLSSVVA